jgi:hypothetical protein
MYLTLQDLSFEQDFTEGRMYFSISSTVNCFAKAMQFSTAKRRTESCESCAKVKNNCIKTEIKCSFEHLEAKVPRWVNAERRTIGVSSVHNFA